MLMHNLKLMLYDCFGFIIVFLLVVNSFYNGKRLIAMSHMVFFPVEEKSSFDICLNNTHRYRYLFLQNSLEDLYSLLCFLHVEPWCEWAWYVFNIMKHVT